MSVPDKVVKLVERFHLNLDACERGQYENELYGLTEEEIEIVEETTK